MKFRFGQQLRAILGIARIALLCTSAIGPILFAAACGRPRLSREAAEGLIRPKVMTSVATVPLPDLGRVYLGDPQQIPYARVFKERGLLREVEIPTRGGGYVSFSLNDKFRQYVRTEAPGGNKMVLATAKFGAIAGLREAGDGRNAEVEFTWEWVPNEAGTLLEGAHYKPGVLFEGGHFPNQFTIALQGRLNSGTATCALYDDGWRCNLGAQRTEYDLSRPGR